MGGKSQTRPVLEELLEIRKGVHLPEGTNGLAGLCLHLVTGCRKWKTKKLQMSNWENCPLTVSQCEYAAMDAWAGLATVESIKLIRAGARVAAASVAASGMEEEGGLKEGGLEDRHDTAELVAIKASSMCDSKANPPPLAQQTAAKVTTIFVGCDICGIPRMQKAQLVQHLAGRAHRSRTNKCDKALKEMSEDQALQEMLEDQALQEMLEDIRDCATVLETFKGSTQTCLPLNL